MTSGSPVVSLREVSKAYPNGTLALDRLSLDVEPGELLSLLGPSGCGKSTLLRLIAGLAEPSAGAIQWGDPEAQNRLGFVFRPSCRGRVEDNVRCPSCWGHEPRQSAARVGRGHRSRQPRGFERGDRDRACGSLWRRAVGSPGISLPRRARENSQLFEGGGDLGVGHGSGIHRAMTESATGPAWLVLPTYNEAENVEPLVEAARAKLPPDAQVLIVDDSSPDGTGAIADRLAARHENVHVLHRPRKEGLGPAYIAGFREALAGGAGLVLEMDADFSHDPAYLPRLLDAAKRADLVLGSRYVEGSGVSDWGTLFPSLLVTLAITAAAFVVSAVLGLILAVLFTQSAWIERAFFPYAVILQVTPLVAIAPLIILWVKWIPLPLLVCAWLVAFFPCLNTVLPPADRNRRPLPPLRAAGRRSVSPSPRRPALFSGRPAHQRRPRPHWRRGGRIRGGHRRRTVGARLPHPRGGLPAPDPSHVRRGVPDLGSRCAHLRAPHRALAPRPRPLARERDRNGGLTPRSLPLRARLGYDRSRDVTAGP